MRIAFVLPSLANRGPIVFTKYLIDELSKISSRIDVYYFDDVDEKTINLGCSCKKISIFEPFDFECYDIIHTTMLRPDFYGILHKAKIKRSGAKVVTGIHNEIKKDMCFTYGSIKGGAISFVWVYLLRWFDGVIFSSKKMREYYLSSLHLNNEIVIPYGISKACADNSLKNSELEEISSKYTVIGAVGHLINRKGFHQIINSLVSLKEHALIIVGDGPELNDLKKLVADNGLECRVVFVGFVNNSISYYKYFDIYCMSSYSEGFGLAMLEALSFKLPLVCSNLDIYKGFFCNDDVGLFNLDDTESLTSAITTVTNNLNYYAQSSYNLYGRFFTSKVMAERHLDYYISLQSKS
ncbi:glycosyltransferase family 4 protein [Photobacterium sp. WH24]|uniref:glycosyltransferase family 4 protein n=1 Tax=Photobacterium sp. WH24 TaxID=2827237 RepID=UPI001C47ED6D|nr:glycosyltransferase family 4 protein [Photobacterium sp. WH24]MBV7260593.1 glycosyltransferase family 4 protein [Photobacterium sp. WH24]